MFVDELRTITDKVINEIDRKNYLVANLKKRLLEEAKKGKFYYEMKVYEELSPELLEIMREEGLIINSRTIRQKIQQFMFQEDEDKYENVTIYTFSWSK